MSIKDLFFKITARDQTGSAFTSVNRRLRETDGLSASVSDRISRAGRSMQRFGAVGSVASIGVAAAFRDVIGHYDEQARAEAKVRQAVLQTAGAAGLAAEQLYAQASALQEVTRFGDEDILNNVTAQLLTFKNISGEAFLGAQEAALDLATLLDGDLQSASISLGKALNDPAKGLSALTEKGITFSEAQSDIIKSLARTGDVAGAQRLILEEIASAYGDQAEAARQAGAGIVDAWAGIWGDVKEVVGGVLVDTLPPIVDSMKSVTGAFQAMSPEGQKTVVMLGALAVAIPPVTAALGLMAVSVNALMGPVGLVVLAIAGLAGAAALLWPEKDKVTQSIDLLTGAIGDEITQAQLLHGVISSDVSMSVSAARQKLEEAKARLRNVQAIYEEKRALGLAAAGRAGVGAMSMPQWQVDEINMHTRNGTLQQSRYRTNDGSSPFDPRAQAEYEGRVDWSGNRGVSDPIFSPEHASEIELITDNIAALELAIAAAENGVVTFGNGLVVPIETAERLKQEIGGGGGLNETLKDLTETTENYAKSETWGSIKDNLRALAVEGQSWADTWKGIFGSVVDRLFDLAFSPAWDALFDNLEDAFGKSTGSAKPGGGNALGNIFSGLGDWVGNILGLDTGGDVTVSSKAGIDRNMTVLRTSDNERVSVRRQGDSGSGPQVIVNIQTADPQAFQASRAQIGHQIARAVAAGNRAA